MPIAFGGVFSRAVAEAMIYDRMNNAGKTD